MEGEEIIKRVKRIIKSDKSIEHKTRNAEKHLIMDFNDFLDDYELAEVLLENPEEFLRGAEIAIGSIREDGKELPLRLKGPYPNTSKLKIRHIRVKNLKQFHYFKGIIKQVSKVKALEKYKTYECQNCGRKRRSKGKKPKKCKSCNTKALKKVDTKMVDMQRVVLEEKLENLEGDVKPRKLNIILEGGLTSKELNKINVPGSEIMASGVLETFVPDRKKKEEKEYVLMANYITPMEETYQDIEISNEEKEKIKNLSKKENLIEAFKNSYAPDIHGMDIIKKAIVLQLFGGSEIRNEEGKKIRRDTSHILLVGDPGLGKSQLGKFVGNISPKFRYASGSGASGTGLTSTVVQDKFLGTWSVEGGAMVLSSGGNCIIDEIDKIEKEDRGKLNEAMAHQKISVDRANIHTTLKAETALLAIANPVNKRFDRYDEVYDQIGLSTDILTRFDLIFPIKDTVEKEKDMGIIEKMIEIRAEENSVEPEIDNKFFRKYIAYAKKNVNPRLSKNAKKEIKKVYWEIRKKSTDKTIAITPRQGEALMRLSESAAKMRLSERVAVKDVEIAKEIMYHYLNTVALDMETGQIDIDKIEMGMSSSKRDKIKMIRDIIKENENEEGNVSVLTVVSEAETKGIEESEVEEILERMSTNGDILKPRHDVVQILR